MNKNIIVGIHVLHHDGCIATYDLNTQEFKYLKFERISEIKNDAHHNFDHWEKYLNHLNYDVQDVNYLCLINCWNFPNKLYLPSLPNLKDEIIIIDHHLAHHLATGGKNSLIIDGVGSQEDNLTIFKNDKEVFKLDRSQYKSLGLSLCQLWYELGFKKSSDAFPYPDYAGHTMALSAFGRNYSSEIDYNFIFHEEVNMKLFLEKSKTHNYNDYVTSLHFYHFKKIKKILDNFFSKYDEIFISGGVGHNIILNTLLKDDFHNIKATPHCGDEGLVFGAINYVLQNKLKQKFQVKNYCQNDDNFGYARKETIKKVANFLHQGKLVMWGQGWGEVGPRALGYRSILMNPCTPNAKEIINEKIKKRIWFRPYGASVPKECYKDYFDLDFDSPWMLYQAKVKDPVKFENITHADGTCRIQTVDTNDNPPYLKLLKAFGELSGYPVLINTSMNLPGKPIVGTRKQAKIMFDNSQADVLVMGDEIYTK